MHNIEELREKVKDAIISISYERKPVELYDPIRYSLKMGGKRLRPTLTLLACELFNGTADDALKAAIGLEIFHNFTLLHDDIMDEAPKRRGQDTVYKKWDTNRAILSGDTMFAMAYQYILKTPTDYLPQVLGIFNQTAIEVCEGQQYDMNFETQEDVSLDDYLEMIRLKTAVLVATALKIGAVIGGAAIDQANLLYQYGEAIGLAFQLKDDLLDVYGDEDKFGKVTGGDIVANKKTYLFLKAYELADDIQKKALIDLFDDVGMEDEIKVYEVKSIYDKLNIRSVTNKAIDTYYRQGLKHLNDIEIEEDKKAFLKDFTDQLMNRDR